MRCLVVLLFLVAGCSPAFASIELCNKFQHPIHFAFAYEISDGWVSEG
jgi:uncharacterized membrane protein